MSDLESKIDAIANQLTTLQSDVTSLQSDVTSLQSDVTEVKTRLGHVETELTLTNVRVDTYQKASNQVVNLAFGLIATATITIVVSVLLK